MARIACVAKQYNEIDVCGTLISNCAFQHWAYHLGHQAVQVGFTGRGKPLKNWIDPGEGMLKAYGQDAYYDVLNGSYDAVYFSTGGSRPSSRRPPEFMEFKHLRVPFIVGVHDEDDYAAYEENLRAMAEHRMFRGFVVNGVEAFELIPIHAPKYLWFPCTLPAYLLKESTEWNEGSRGLLYAGRLIHWRRLPILAELTKSDAFMDQVQSIVEVRGPAPGVGGHALEEKLAAMGPRWSRLQGFFDILNCLAGREMYRSRRFFWDVGRTDPGKRYYRRLNLVAVEALGQGSVPIVSPEFAPAWTHEFCVLFDHRSWSIEDTVRKLRAINERYDNHRAHMREIILNSPWSFEGVKAQFRKVLDALLN